MQWLRKKEIQLFFKTIIQETLQPAGRVIKTENSRMIIFWHKGIGNKINYEC